MAFVSFVEGSSVVFTDCSSDLRNSKISAHVVYELSLEYSHAPTESIEDRNEKELKCLANIFFSFEHIYLQIVFLVLTNLYNFHFNLFMN